MASWIHWTKILDRFPGPHPDCPSQPAPRWLFWGSPRTFCPAAASFGMNIRHELRTGEVDLMIADFVRAPRLLENTFITPAPAAAHS